MGKKHRKRRHKPQKSKRRKNRRGDGGGAGGTMSFLRGKMRSVAGTDGKKKPSKTFDTILWIGVAAAAVFFFSQRCG